MPTMTVMGWRRAKTIGFMSILGDGAAKKRTAAS
jgi:hypothetical protein